MSAAAALDGEEWRVAIPLVSVNRTEFGDSLDAGVGGKWESVNFRDRTEKGRQECDKENEILQIKVDEH